MKSKQPSFEPIEDEKPFQVHGSSEVGQRFEAFEEALGDFDIGRHDLGRLQRLERRLERLDERSPDEMTDKEARIWARVDAILERYELPDLETVLFRAENGQSIDMSEEETLDAMAADPWGSSPEVDAIWAEMDVIFAKYPMPELSVEDQARLDELAAMIDELLAANGADLEDELEALWEEMDQIWANYPPPEITGEDEDRLEELQEQLGQVFADLYQPTDEAQAIFDQIDAIWAAYPAGEPTAEEQAQLDVLYAQVGLLEDGPDGEPHPDAAALWEQIDQIWAQYSPPELSSEDETLLEQLYAQLDAHYAGWLAPGYMDKGLVPILDLDFMTYSDDLPFGGDHHDDFLGGSMIDPWERSPEARAIWDEMDQIWAKYPMPEPSEQDKSRLEELARQIDALVQEGADDIGEELEPIWQEMDQIWAAYPAPELTAEDQTRLDQLQQDLDQIFADLYKPSDEVQAIYDEIDGIWANYPPPQPTAEDQDQLDGLHGQLKDLTYGPNGEPPPEAEGLFSAIDQIWAKYPEPTPSSEHQARLDELYGLLDAHYASWLMPGLLEDGKMPIMANDLLGYPDGLAFGDFMGDDHHGEDHQGGGNPDGQPPAATNETPKGSEPPHENEPPMGPPPGSDPLDQLLVT